MIDSHTHLFASEFDLDRKEVIARAYNSGVKKLMMVGFSAKTNQLAYDLAQEYDYIYNSCGLHPSDVKDNYLEELTTLENFLHEHKVYALGECGLDFYWDKTYVSEQKLAFRKQIELSIKYNLPLIIHSREAIQDTYNILKEYPQAYGVMHCYSGSLEMALEFVKLGFYIGIGGPVTFKNAKEPKRVANNIPLEKLVIETDSPYLAPSPFRGKRNESSYVKYVLEEIASLRGMSVEELEKVCDENTNKLFRMEAKHA